MFLVATSVRGSLVWSRNMDKMCLLSQMESFKRVITTADGKIFRQLLYFEAVLDLMPMVVGHGQGNALRSIQDIAMLILY